MNIITTNIYFDLVCFVEFIYVSTGSQQHGEC